MKTIQREIVSAIIFSRNEKLLMVKKVPSGGGVYFDCWHIPGGGIDKGEIKESALKREIKEEVGIDISPYKIKLISDDGIGSSEKILKDTDEKVIVEMHFNVYQIRINDKESSEIAVILEEKELSEYAWFSLEELPSVKLTPPSVELFIKLKYL